VLECATAKGQLSICSSHWWSTPTRYKKSKYVSHHDRVMFPVSWRQVSYSWV